MASAQVDNARATLKNAQDQLAKQERSYAIEPKSVSLDALDNARNAENGSRPPTSRSSQRQYELTKAGAWVYDIQNQERQVHGAGQGLCGLPPHCWPSTRSGRPPTAWCARIQAGVGSYVSPQGAYDSYTEGMNPLIVMSTPHDNLQVRVYVDEILIHRLPDPSKMSAEMFIRGTDTHLPLTFTRIQPYVSPKIELSDARQERVDLRVLPLIFRFENPKNSQLYPGPIGGRVCRREAGQPVVRLSPRWRLIFWPPRRLRRGSEFSPPGERPPLTQYSSGDPATTAAARRYRADASSGSDVCRRLVDAVPISEPLDARDRGGARNNPGLDAAEASLRASQDTLRSGYGIFFPSIGADAGADARALSPPPISDRAPPAACSICSRSARPSATPSISSAASGAWSRNCRLRSMCRGPRSRPLISH